MSTNTQPTNGSGSTAAGFWDDAEVISTYSRAQAIADGVLVDASIGELAPISRHLYRFPVAMTAEVFAIIQAAVENKRADNSLAGVWHDIMWMSRMRVYARPDPSTVLFTVKIRGAGRRQIYAFKLVCGPGDNAEPVLTLMLPEQD